MTRNTRPAPADDDGATLIGGSGQRQLAERAEAADTRNWLDQRDAAPPEVRQAFGLRHLTVDGLAVVASSIAFSHFNMVHAPGCPARLDERAWTTIEQFYGDQEHWIVTGL